MFNDDQYEEIVRKWEQIDTEYKPTKSTQSNSLEKKAIVANSKHQERMKWIEFKLQFERKIKKIYTKAGKKYLIFTNARYPDKLILRVILYHNTQHLLVDIYDDLSGKMFIEVLNPNKFREKSEKKMRKLISTLNDQKYIIYKYNIVEYITALCLARNLNLIFEPLDYKFLVKDYMKEFVYPNTSNKIECRRYNVVTYL